MKPLLLSLLLFFSQATFSQNNKKTLNKMSYDELKNAFNAHEGKISLQNKILKVYLNRAKKENNIEKKAIQQEIQILYEDVIQLEQALIELDDQNTLNAVEIRKRDFKG